MENNIIEKYKNEANESLVKELGITFDEFKSLSCEELKLIFFNQSLKDLKKHSKESKNDRVDLILDNFRKETNQIILDTYGITFDEFREISIPELINLVRTNKKDNKQKIK